MTAQAERPAAVTALGCIFIAGGAVIILSAVMAHLTRTLLGQGPLQEPLFPLAADLDLSPMQFIEKNMLGHSDALRLVTILYGGFVILNAAYFLRLRGWARYFLDGISLQCLVFVLGLRVFWTIMWLGVTGPFPDRGLPTDALRITGVAVSLLLTLIYAAPCVVLLRLLRSPTVRQAMCPQPPPTAPVQS